MGHGTRVIPLPRGGTLAIRPATRRDVNGLIGLYESLSPEDRHRRFFTASVPSRTLLERFVDVMERSGLWLVAVTEDGEVVADGGYARLADGDAELALTVRKTWRGWLGPYLLDVLVQEAADDGVRNLRANILLGNRPMLSLVERRGYATVDQPDRTMLSVTMSTQGGPPAWPPARDRPRVLVEGCGARWHADIEAWAGGWDIITCVGPGSRSMPACPVLEGKRCPLVDGADLVVVALPPTDSRHDALLKAHERVPPPGPVLDEATLSPTELSRHLRWIADQRVSDGHL